MPPQIPPAIAATFDVLRTSDTVNLPDVLFAALAAPCEAVQFAAAEVLLARPSIHEHARLVERLPHLPESVRDLAAQSSQALSAALAFALEKSTPAARRCAQMALRSTGMTAVLPQLLAMVLEPASPSWELAVETLHDVIARLDDRREDAATATLREQALRDLERTAAECRYAPAAELFAEAALVLGNPSHPPVRSVIWHGSQQLREAAQRLLRTSRHPGVLRFLTASLAEAYPHPQVFAALRERRDVEFASALLRSLGGGPPPRHLQQIDHIGWLTPPLEVLEVLPPALLPAVATLVQATRLPRGHKAAVLEWLLCRGTPAAKLAATSGLSLLDETRAKEVVRENLAADDPEVQAWATLHLRHCGVPKAHVLLIERLGSPHAAVRDAARHELSGFNVAHVLSRADEWSTDEARRAGRLLQQVDPHAADGLQRELLHPARQKRIRAAKAVLKLGLQDVALDALLAMSRDADPLVRRTAAEALAQVGDAVASDRLEELCDDEHERVRTTAAAALRRRSPANHSLPVRA
jgi:hypothetical protein